MIELLIILLVIICALCFTLRKPERPSSSVYSPSPIIEDSSLLKQQYADLEAKHHASLQTLGQFQSELKLSKSMNVQNGALILEMQAKFDKLQHQNKSSQVRTGAIGESLLPLHEDFPCNPKTLRLLGSPIDYISFCYETDMITFLEIKTGESQLNDNQRNVKRMVEEGKVQFKVVRLNEKGMKVK